MSLFQNASEFVQERVLLVQHYPLLRKITSNDGTPQDLPAFGFQELIRLSYESPQLARDLAQYLTVECLPKRQPVGQVKTLKTLDQLARHGSKHFRVELRQLDEHLRMAAKHSITRETPTGSAYDEAIRSSASDIRIFIFEHELARRDETEGPDEPLKAQATLSGLGSSGQKGKYEGFGNVPAAKENLGDRLLSSLESALSPTDDRAEVMAMCLKSDPGGYTPISMANSMTSSQGWSESSKTVTKAKPTRHHVPGRAGGGWESSDDDEVLEERDQLRQMAELSMQTSRESSRNLDESPLEGSTEIEEGVEAKPDESSEARILGSFLEDDQFPAIGDIRETFGSLSVLNNVSAVYLIMKNISEAETTNARLRCLLLLEFYLQSDLVHAEVLYQKCLPGLEALVANPQLDNGVLLKAKKLTIIIRKLKALKHP